MSLIRNLALRSSVLLLAVAGILVFAPPPASAQQCDLSGAWSASNITGGGTYTYTSEDGTKTLTITGGTINLTVAVSGDIWGTGTFSVGCYEEWFGTSPVIHGKVTILGEDHDVKLWLKGKLVELRILGLFPLQTDVPYVWQVDVSCPDADVGHTHGWTTDGSNLVADFGWSGTCSWTVVFRDDGTWQVTDTGTGTGTWTGKGSYCFTGKMEDIEAGIGTVILSGSPDVALFSYDVQTAGTVLLAQYKINPGGTPTRQTLGKYIQVDSNIINPLINWPVELRVYYTDAEVAAAGIVEGTLKLYKWDGTNWTVVSDTGVNTTDNYVWARLTSFSSYSPQGEVRGDVSGDGVIDVRDARLCLQIAMGYFTGTAAQRSAADVDGDGDVDLTDAQILAQYIIGIRATLP